MRVTLILWPKSFYENTDGTPELNKNTDGTPELNKTTDATPELNKTTDATPELNKTTDATPELNKNNYNVGPTPRLASEFTAKTWKKYFGHIKLSISNFDNFFKIQISSTFHWYMISYCRICTSEWKINIFHKKW